MGSLSYRTLLAMQSSEQACQRHAHQSRIADPDHCLLSDTFAAFRAFQVRQLQQVCAVEWGCAANDTDAQ